MIPITIKGITLSTSVILCRLTFVTSFPLCSLVEQIPIEQPVKKARRIAHIKHTGKREPYRTFTGFSDYSICVIYIRLGSAAEPHKLDGDEINLPISPPCTVYNCKTHSSETYQILSVPDNNWKPDPVNLTRRNPRNGGGNAGRRRHGFDHLNLEALTDRTSTILCHNGDIKDTW